MNASLEQMVRRAARPAHGMVPADVEAVFFADRAELLACLAYDWCDGTAATRWWWQSLLQGGDSVKVILASWREAPQYIPGTLQYLAMNGKAVQFVQALSVSDARVILERMTEVFDLSELRLALRAAAGWDLALAIQSDTVEGLPQGDRQSPPWQRWVPEGQGDGVGVEQRYVLGLGLMLHRAPLVVRTQSFAQAVEDWTRRQSRRHTQFEGEGVLARFRDPQHIEQLVLDTQLNNAVIPLETDSQAVRPDSPPKTMEPVSMDEPHSDSAAISSPSPLTSSLSSAAVRVSEMRGEREVIESAADERRSAGEQPVLAPAPWPIPPTGAEQGDRIESQPVSPQGESSVAGLEAEAVSVTEAVVETSFGGVFYLMNLALYLNLYGDFSTPLQPGIALSPWDFLALVGEQLIGERIHADPVWPLLAQLAGRDEGEVPGQDFHPPAEWRLQMMEQWGYDAQSAPDQWASIPAIEWLMPFIRARLMRALGLDQEHELAKVLCAHRATVHVTATHVDVMLSLADLPIAIRLAGLDRNPGWIPAAGRYLAFHFA